MPQKRKNKKKQADKSEQPIAVTPPAGMRSGDMQHIIAMAIVEAEEIKEQRNQAKAEEETKQWRADIGYKEYNDKSKLWRGIKTFFNRLKCILKLFVIPENKIRGDRASYSLIQLVLKLFFELSKLMFGLAAIVSVCFGVVGLCITPVISPAWIGGIYLVLIAVPFLMLSLMFRMASIEVEKIEDRNYLFGLFASVTSIVSIIIAIVAVVKGG